MSIDWFTVLAQFINFFILLWLLKYFLYEPITNAIDSREQRIQERFEEAEQQREEARLEKESYRNQKQELQQRRDSFLEEAQEEGARRREELVEEARAEVDSLHERWERELRQEKDQFLKELRERAQGAVQDQVSRVLRALADDDLTDRTVRTFIARLGDLTDEERHDFLESIGPSGEELRVLSSIALAEETRDQIRSELQDVFNRRFDVEFQVEPDLVAGLEVEGNGRKIGWSVRDVLDRIERRVAGHFEEEVLPDRPDQDPADEEDPS